MTGDPIFERVQSPGWFRWSFERHYRITPEGDSDPQAWARRRTPQDGRVTGWIRVDDKGIAELFSETVDDTGQVWMQSRLVRGQTPVARDWTRCSHIELDGPMPESVTELVSEDLGSITPPEGARRHAGGLTWTEPQGVITLRVHQSGASPLDRRVEAVSNGSRSVLFELSSFRLEPVSGPPEGVWVPDAEFRQACQPLDTTTGHGSSSELTG